LTISHNGSGKVELVGKELLERQHPCWRSSCSRNEKKDAGKGAGVPMKMYWKEMERDRQKFGSSKMRNLE